MKKPAAPGLSVILFVVQTIIAILFSVAAARLATFSQWDNALRIMANQQNLVGRISLNPDTTSLNSNGSGSIVIQVDTGGVAVNSVEVYITYPTDIVRATGLSFTNSICSIIITQAISATEGSAHIACGLPYPGINTQIGKVATLNYTAVSNGIAQFHLDPLNTFLLANDGAGTNVLRYTDDTAVSIGGVPLPASTTTESTKPTSTAVQSPVTTTQTTTSPSKTTSTSSRSTTTQTTTTAKTASPAPSGSGSTGRGTGGTAPAAAAITLNRVPVVSTTHDLYAKCTPATEAGFRWLKQDGVESFEYELNSDSSTMSSPKSTTDTRITLPVVQGALQYFHVRSKAGNVVSQPGVIAIRTCPAGYQLPTYETTSSTVDDVGQTVYGLLRTIGQYTVTVIRRLLFFL